MPIIRRAETRDLPALAALAAKLFSGDEAEHFAELSPLLPGADAALFLCEEGGAPAGFAQAQLRRDYVEGSSTSPVGYLEGVYVEPDFRRRGFAQALLRACEAWAREKGCAEFASDCELENEASAAFHARMGGLCGGEPHSLLPQASVSARRRRSTSALSAVPQGAPPRSGTSSTRRHSASSP